MKSEEPYKHIEDKIKMVVNAHEYPYSEAAWKRMELLLNQKDDKKRPFFWLWSMVIIGVLFGGYLIVYKKSNLKKSLALHSGIKIKAVTLIDSIKEQSKVDRTDLIKKPIILDSISGNSIVNSSDNVLKKLPQKFAIPMAKKLINAVLSKQKTSKDIEQDDEPFSKQKENYKNSSRTSIKINNGESGSDDKIANKDLLAAKSNEANEKKIVIENPINELEQKKSFEIIVKENRDEKKDTVLNSLVEKNANKSSEHKKHKILSSFYALGTYGREANTTRLLSFSNTTITPNYGLDLGYQINKRLSVQAGFHASAKKYIAGPNDYNVKQGSYLSTVKIIEVDANCLVYQMPITVQYNWLLKKAFSLYGSAGLSSYIMKKEDYNYTFDNYFGRYTYPYSYTGNKHLFAGANLSVGIEKRINNKFYLQAAPIVTIPIKGVGYGTVKLFSTSFNFGIKYFPLKK